MATMIPSNVDNFSTPGEGELYRFFKTALRPDADIFAWHNPHIEKCEPDFILYTPECGLVVFEVKDWMFSQIRKVESDSVLLEIGDQLESRKHPLPQAIDYSQKLQTMLRKYSNQVVDYTKNLPCSVMWGIIFPHIKREEYLGSALARSIPEDRVMLMDDLLETSPLRKDASGQALRKWLKETFPPKFINQMDRSKLKEVCDSICPPAFQVLPRQKPANTDQADTILKLDHKQETLASRYHSGKMLISGPAGSGKTLILAHQAWNLPRSNKIQKVLFVCFNLALAGYIKRLLSRKGARFGDAHVTVLPFYDVCDRITKLGLKHADEGADYYKATLQLCLDELDREDHPLRQNWDAILVDEGQDFTADMAKVLTCLLRPDGVLIVAQDKDQSLYHTDDKAWQEVCPDLREYTLTQQYRNTRTIATFAARLQTTPSGTVTFEGANGPEPSWIQAPEWRELVHRVADAVAERVEAGVPMNEIAVLYTHKIAGEEEDALPDALHQALEARGLLTHWASKDEYGKRNYDITTDSVTISTIHSVKGMDFAHVFLLGLDLLGKDTPQNRNLAHVGITRAREQLTLGVCGENWLTALLR